MRDTTEDHAAAIVERCKVGDIWGADLFVVADHATALAAERDALRKYARKKELQVQALLNEIADSAGIPRKIVSVEKMREADGVAEIMAREDR